MIITQFLKVKKTQYRRLEVILSGNVKIKKYTLYVKENTA